MRVCTNCGSQKHTAAQCTRPRKRRQLTMAELQAKHDVATDDKQKNTKPPSFVSLSATDVSDNGSALTRVSKYEQKEGYATRNFNKDRTWELMQQKIEERKKEKAASKREREENRDALFKEQTLYDKTKESEGGEPGDVSRVTSAGKIPAYLLDSGTDSFYDTRTNTLRTRTAPVNLAETTYDPAAVAAKKGDSGSLAIDALFTGRKVIVADEKDELFTNMKEDAERQKQKLIQKKTELGEKDV